MSVLPEHLEQNTIRNMTPGDKGYTVSWAMWADLDRNLWINGNYTIHDDPHGTVKMLIERTKDGVIVYKRTIKDERYSLQAGPCYVGGSDDLPVSFK
jgi:hypothetical protein